MDNRRKIMIWVTVLAVAIVAVVQITRWSRRHRAKILPTLVGAVVKQTGDAKTESPIADVTITVGGGAAGSAAKSDFSGYFKLIAGPEQPAVLHFRHPDYEPLDITTNSGSQLYIARMTPIHSVATETKEGGVLISNALVRYSTQATSTDNIGTGVKTFQIANTGNLPCNQQSPCSPDGKWKATIDSASLDAGEGNVFQNARVSCIAGPCPFTRIDFDGFSRTARDIRVTVRNWSDTTTFLLQAEVFHTQMRDIVRKSYPVIFGRSLNFTLPADAGGLTIEAELNGAQIIFPLPPEPRLSWADCKVRIEANQAKDYRCELKPGYRFR